MLPNHTLRNLRFTLFVCLALFSSLRIPNSIGESIAKGTAGIFPLRDCMIRKVKMLKKPKFDILKLMEMHDAAGEDTGAKVARDEDLPETQAGSGGRL
jgi:small subunit ribosomal protein S3Ae